MNAIILEAKKFDCLNKVLKGCFHTNCNYSSFHQQVDENQSKLKRYSSMSSMDTATGDTQITVKRHGSCKFVFIGKSLFWLTFEYRLPKRSHCLIILLIKLSRIAIVFCLVFVL